MLRLKTEAWSTFKLAIPMMLGQCAVHLTQVIDAAMIGRVGVNELAAAAFASNFYMVFLMMGFGMTVALSIFVAGAFGREDDEEQRTYLSTGLLAATGFGLFIALIMYWAVGLSEYLGQPREVLQHAQTYLVILGWSTAPVLVMAGLKGACESVNKPWFAVPFALGVLPLNVFLNWIFIYGNLGMPAWGLDGAGFATLLSRLIMIVWMWFAIGKQGLFGAPLGLFEMFQRGFSKMWTLLKMGFSAGLQITFEVASFNAAAIMMGWIGAAALAAHQIAINIVGLVFMIPLSLSFAVSIRVGQALGANKPEQARTIGWANALVSVLFMSVSAFCFWLFREPMIGMFLGRDLPDAEAVLQAGMVFLIIAAIFQIGDGLNIIMVGFLRGYRDVRIPTILTFIIFWGVGLPLAFFLAFGEDVVSETMPDVFRESAALGASLGGVGIWIALAIALCVGAVVMAARARWIANRACAS